MKRDAGQGADADRGTGVVPAVVMAGVSVRFPRRASAVLDGVSLTLAPGEQVVVFGPSGAGKSTLLQTLTGVVPHSVVAELEGSVTIDGVDTAGTRVAELSRGIGVLAQDPASGVCLPVVEQELALPLENRGTAVELIAGRIDAALDAVSATALRSRSTAQLSGGEGQRVALAASLVAEPAVLLLDEPTSMLDADGIASVRSAIGRAVQRYGPAVVLVEHRLDEYAGGLGAAGLPARAIVLDAAGRVVADGPTATVLRDSAASLHAAGCWLPLDAELQAVFGAAGGLAAAEVRAGLLGLGVALPIAHVATLHEPSAQADPGRRDVESHDDRSARDSTNRRIEGRSSDETWSVEPSTPDTNGERVVPGSDSVDPAQLLPSRTTVASTPDTVVRTGNSHAGTVLAAATPSTHPTPRPAQLFPARTTVASTPDTVVRTGTSRAGTALETATPSTHPTPEPAQLFPERTTVASTPDTAVRTGNSRGAVVLAASGLAVSRGESAAGTRHRRQRRQRGQRGATSKRPRASDRSAAQELAAATVLRDIDLELHAGEIVALLGANGTGKSTLLLALAGLLSPTAGTVAGPRAGLIFQNPEHQFVAESVRGEVGHGLPAGSDALVASLLAEHRLAHLAEQSPYRLSGGEKRRLSVAAMLAHDRPALLADEPTFGLDRRATVASIRAFRAAADAGRAVLFSSHDLRTVATLAHRAIVVAEGTIVADGPVLDVLRDRSALSRARLSLPPLVEWLLTNAESDAAVRRTLDALDDAVPAPARAPDRGAAS